MISFGQGKSLLTFEGGHKANKWAGQQNGVVLPTDVSGRIVSVSTLLRDYGDPMS